LGNISLDDEKRVSSQKKKRWRMIEKKKETGILGWPAKDKEATRIKGGFPMRPGKKKGGGAIPV